MLGRAAEQLAEGDLETRANLRGNDELAQLAHYL
ncbi:MAG: HAMP domain-containing protein [Calothrix sp. SM1_5_4]|nr:HAMP domain-containing protein [Calothrix sp. SM1_5_4]